MTGSARAATRSVSFARVYPTSFCEWPGLSRHRLAFFQPKSRFLEGGTATCYHSARFHFQSYSALVARRVQILTLISSYLGLIARVTFRFLTATPPDWCVRSRVGGKGKKKRRQRTKINPCRSLRLQPTNDRRFPSEDLYLNVTLLVPPPALRTITGAPDQVIKGKATVGL